MRSFRRAAELDPAAPMPHWGIALALGPNINDYDVDAAREKAAYDEAQRARTLAARAPAQRARLHRCARPALLDRAQRRPEGAGGPLQGRDAASWSRRYPDDLDAATLYAESLMDLHPWSCGRPTASRPRAPKRSSPRSRQCCAAIRCTSARTTTTSTPSKRRRRPAARWRAPSRLETLVPDAGHLVHMPAHIYMRTGNYEGAVASNAKAADVDRQYIKARRRQRPLPDRCTTTTTSTSSHRRP